MLHRLEAGEFAAVWQIMEASFPPNEIRTYEGQKALLDDPLYAIHIARDSCSQVMGFMAVWDFADFAFLEHFAVAPAYRNHRLGSSMLGELLAGQGKMLCLEVEPPESSMARRRIDFYRRNDFFLNDFPYAQPSLGQGKEAIPLCIMTSGSCVDAQHFATIKGTLYAKVYGLAPDIA